METKFTNENCTISVSESIIMMEWVGTVKEAAYKQALTEALTIAKNKQISLWLSDVTKLISMAPALQTWAMENWVPEVVGADCYKKQAVIQAGEITGKVVTHTLKNKIRNADVPVQFGEFKTHDEAFTWLLS
jgi:hypothetical protein